MTFSMLLFFAFVVMGLTNIIVESTIFEKFRELWKGKLPEFFGDAIECHQCVGFWAGMFASLLFAGQPFVVMLCCGFAGSFIAPFEKVLRNYLIEHYLYIACKSIEATDEH